MGEDDWLESAYEDQHGYPDDDWEPEPDADDGGDWSDDEVAD